MYNEDNFIAMYQHEEFGSFFFGSVIAAVLCFILPLTIAYFTGGLTEGVIYGFGVLTIVAFVYNFIGYIWAKIGYVARKVVIGLLWCLLMYVFYFIHSSF